MGNEYNRVRIGVGHPGVKDAVAHYVLHDFAKVEYAWLDPLLDAMAEAAPFLAKGDSSRFLSQVALKTRDDDAPEEREPPPKPKSERAPRKPHPAGERVAKRAGALAENLKKWLAGRGDKE
jgi:PTH1 family peptidyl-tRNA hydrolase